MAKKFLDSDFFNSSYDLLEENREKLDEILENFCHKTFKIDFEFENLVGLNVKRLLNEKSEKNIGDFTLMDLKFIAKRQFNLPEEAVGKIFGEENMFRRVYCLLSERETWIKAGTRDDLIPYEEVFEGAVSEMSEDLERIVSANVVANFNCGVPTYFKDFLNI
nr:MAG: hypothetical protein [Porcellio scaber clopovirus]